MKQESMRIAIITLDFPPAIGGVQQYLFELARRLGQQHEVVVVCPHNPRSHMQDTFQCYSLSSDHPLAFWRALRDIRPERVLVGHAHPRLLLPAAVTAWGHFLTIAHGNDYQAAQHCWHRQLFNRLLGHSRPLITTTRINAARLQHLGIGDAVVIHPGTSPTRFTPSPVPPPFPPLLLTVARLVPSKGIATVLQVLPVLLNEFPGLRYQIVGDGPDRSHLEGLARSMGVHTQVEFRGAMTGIQLDSTLPDLYRNAHIFVMPARDEGFGIVYLEASASGLPVVAGRSGGSAEAVRDGETGLLVPPEDPTALAQAIQHLLSDAHLRQRMGQAGRQWVEQEMNWDRAAREMLSVLKLHS